jgi:hypothetical protein
MKPQEGRREIGVVVGEEPGGPRKDYLGKPFLESGLVPSEVYDPALFKDEDGHIYIIFGVWDYYIARVRDDMTGIAEVPPPSRAADGSGIAVRLKFEKFVAGPSSRSPHRPHIHSDALPPERMGREGWTMGSVGGGSSAFSFAFHSPDASEKRPCLRWRVATGRRAASGRHGPFSERSR